MAQITWQNIDAPSLREGAAIMQQGSQNLQSGIDALMDLSKQQTDMNIAADNKVKADNTIALMDQIRQAATSDEVAGMDLQTLMGSVDGKADSAKVLDMLMNRENALQADERADRAEVRDIQRLDDQLLNSSQNRRLKDSQEYRTLTDWQYDNKVRNTTNAANTYGMEIGRLMLGGGFQNEEDARFAIDLHADELISDKRLDPAMKKTYVDSAVKSMQDHVKPTQEQAQAILIRQGELTRQRDQEVAAQQAIFDSQVAKLPELSNLELYQNRGAVEQQADLDAAITEAANKFPAEFGDSVFSNVWNVGRGEYIEEFVADEVADFENDMGIDNLPPDIVTAVIKTLVAESDRTSGELSLDSGKFQAKLREYTTAYNNDKLYHDQLAILTNANQAVLNDINRRIQTSLDALLLSTNNPAVAREVGNQQAKKVMDNSTKLINSLLSNP
jgi:hypothetical protein